LSEPHLKVSPRQNRLITTSILVGAMMVSMDSTIANVALPQMRATFSASQEQVSWILSSYIVAAAIMTPLSAYLADRFGKKEVLIISFTGFSLASVLCGLSTSVEMMVAFRILQGALGAAVFPLSQSIVLDITPLEKYGQAMALVGMGFMVGPILGPILGGYITDTWGWPWIFHINLPIGILGAIGIARFLPNTELSDRPFDLFGFALLAISIGAIQLMLDRGQSLDWFASPEIIIEFTVGVVCFYMFVVHLATGRQPFIEPRLFSDKNFSTGLIVSFMLGITFVAAIALIPLFLQQLANYPARLAGLVLAPRGLGMMIGMFAVSRLIGRVDERYLIAFGLSLSGWMMWITAGFTPDVTTWKVIWTGAVQNFGIGLVFVPLSTLAFTTLAPELRTMASSLYNLVRNIGSSIGLAIVFTLLARGIQSGHAIYSEDVTPFNETLNGSLMPDQFDLTNTPGLFMFDMMINREATIASYQSCFMFLTVFTFASLPLLFALRRPNLQANPATA